MDTTNSLLGLRSVRRTVRSFLSMIGRSFLCSTCDLFFMVLSSPLVASLDAPIRIYSIFQCQALHDVYHYVLHFFSFTFAWYFSTQNIFLALYFCMVFFQHLLAGSMCSMTQLQCEGKILSPLCISQI